MEWGEVESMPTNGVLVLVLMAAAAWFLGGLVPLVGASVIALFAGAVVRNTIGTPQALAPGVEFTLSRLLRLAIVLFGTTLSFAEIVSLGGASFLVICVTVVLALGLTGLFGRWVQAPPGLVSLIGAGTAICGATAVLTVGPIIEAKKEEIAFAVTTIFLFNMAAVVVYPLLGHLLALPDATFGVWAGAAIHDTSSVMAASLAYSEPAGRAALVVKLTRTLMLVPLALVFGVIAHRYRSVSVARIFPWFVLWFVLAAGLNTLGLFGPGTVRLAGLLAKFLVVMVMAAVGLSADLRRMREIGLRPFYIGLFASVLIAVVSLGLIRHLIG
ncbi:MAG: putative sulfate exporter family transporter [bacterium]|nr:putative sulfate exporter family transporter [bacterium]